MSREMAMQMDEKNASGAGLPPEAFSNSGPPCGFPVDLVYFMMIGSQIARVIVSTTCSVTGTLIAAAGGFFTRRVAK